MDFGQFLGQMGAQTGAKLSLPNTEEIRQRHLEEAMPQEPKKPAAPAYEPPKPAPQPAQQEQLNEDVVEKVFQVTSAVLKSVRQAFPNKTERRMALESIQNAICMSLNESAPAPRQAQPAPVAPRAYAVPRQPQPQPQAQREGYIIPQTNNLEGMPVEDLNENYSRHIEIAPGQGLAGVSDQDIADLKVLAGIQ